MPAFKYVARLNGAVIGTRRSDRSHTHAVIRNQPGQPVYVLAFCGSLRLAQTEAGRRTSQSGGWRYEIVPAELA